MSGLAQVIEREGIPTTIISILREHSERMMPPRSLWVPFEMGRPIGPPGAVEFQKRVIRAALALLEAPSGPLIVDFPEQAPETSGDDEDSGEGWSCPVSFGPPPGRDGTITDLVEQTVDEIARLRPWFERRLAAGQATTMGPSGFPIEAIPPFLKAVLEGGREPARDRGLDMDQTVRFALQDLKAFYTEAVTARDTTISIDPLRDWFWQETAAARLLFRLAHALRQDSDEDLKFLGLSGIVPNDDRIKSLMADYMERVPA